LISGERVLVEHDDGFVRFYDCGNRERFELVVVPKVLLKEEQLDVYYKAQPHLVESAVQQKEQDKHRTTRRQFDHLDRSRFLLEIASRGKDGYVREKMRAEKALLDDAMQKRVQNEAKTQWNKVRIRRSSLSTAIPGGASTPSPLRSRRCSLSSNAEARRQDPTTVRSMSQSQASKPEAPKTDVSTAAVLTSSVSKRSIFSSIVSKQELQPTARNTSLTYAAAKKQADAGPPINVHIEYSWDEKMQARDQMMRERSVKVEPLPSAVRGSTKNLLLLDSSPTQPSTSGKPPSIMEWKRSDSFRGSMSSFRRGSRSWIQDVLQTRIADADNATTRPAPPPPEAGAGDFGALKAKWRQQQTFGASSGSQTSLGALVPTSQSSFKNQADHPRPPGAVTHTEPSNSRKHIFGMGTSFKIRPNFRAQFAGGP